MNLRKLLMTVSVFFSIITIVLIACGYIFVEAANRFQITRWALLSLGLMFLAGGLNRYIDKRQGGPAYLGVGIFLVVVVVNQFALHM